MIARFSVTNHHYHPRKKKKMHCKWSLIYLKKEAGLVNLIPERSALRIEVLSKIVRDGNSTDLTDKKKHLRPCKN